MVATATSSEGMVWWWGLVVVWLRLVMRGARAMMSLFVCRGG